MLSLLQARTLEQGVISYPSVPPGNYSGWEGDSVSQGSNSAIVSSYLGTHLIGSNKPGFTASDLIVGAGLLTSSGTSTAGFSYIQIVDSLGVKRTYTYGTASLANSSGSTYFLWGSGTNPVFPVSTAGTSNYAIYG